MLNELLVEANRINKKVKNKIKYFNKSTNSRVNPVTKYDKQIELRLIKLLKKNFLNIKFSVKNLENLDLNQYMGLQNLNLKN